MATEISVAIVGAGYAGLSTAWWLTRNGVKDVVIFERDNAIASRASGRNAGIGRQLCEDDSFTALTVEGAQLLRQNFSHVWNQVGGVYLFDSDELWASYIQRAARFGIAVESATGMMKVASDGVIDVKALAMAFADDAIHGGARIECDCQVARVELNRPFHRIATSSGDYRAKVIVDAAGAWGGTLVGNNDLQPTKRHIVMGRGELVASAPFRWRLGVHEAYVRELDGELLFSPCDETACSADDNATNHDVVANSLTHKLIDSRLGLPITLTEYNARACLRTFTPNRQMRLGSDGSTQGLVYALGLGGHGATASPAVGRVVSNAVLQLL
jgi:D-arginine dehydrogenase